MKNIIIIAFFLFSGFLSIAQNDTLILNNGNLIFGEVKGLNKGVLEFETSYSDENFLIEWGSVEKISCVTEFMITTSDGTRYNGSIVSVGESKVGINNIDGYVEVLTDEIVFLKSINKTFISRLSANVDVGFSYAKANNLTQFNGSGLLGYTSDLWQLSLVFNNLWSKQDNAATTERNSGGLTGDYFLPKDYFITSGVNYLTNTEQSIELRYILAAGLGKYIVHTNEAYWSMSTGVSYLNETYSPFEQNDSTLVKTPRSTETEWFLGTEVNLFNTGDFSFYLNGRVYKALGTDNRWRFDLGSNVKYDLPLDFYVKAQLNLNYDNFPAEPGKETDYQYSFGLGWEL